MPMGGHLTIYSNDGTEVLASGIELDRRFDLKNDGLYHSGSSSPIWTAPDRFLGFANSPNSSEVAYAVGDTDFTFGDGLTDMDVCVVVETSPTTTHSLIYVTNGGTLESGFDNPATATNLPSPLPTCVKANYTFVGWYYDTLYTNQATGNDTLTQDTILYAKFIYDNTTVINTKPKIYGYCPAGSRWETVHKEDMGAFYDAIGVKQIAAIGDVYQMTMINTDYKIYPLNETTDNWGITLKLKYTVSGLNEEININPSTSHSWTDKNGNTYILPRIVVDGDYLAYKVVKWDAYHCSDTTNTLFIRFYIQYKTLNTEWTDGIVISEVGSGISEDYLDYVGLYATGAYKVESIGITQLQELEEDILKIKDTTEAIGKRVKSLETTVDKNSSDITTLKRRRQFTEANENYVGFLLSSSEEPLGVGDAIDVIVRDDVANWNINFRYVITSKDGNTYSGSAEPSEVTVLTESSSSDTIIINTYSMVAEIRANSTGTDFELVVKRLAVNATKIVGDNWTTEAKVVRNSMQFTVLQGTLTRRAL